MALLYLPLYLVLIGFLSVFLWIPAFGLGVFLLVREKGCRLVLGVLFALWAPALALVLLLPRAEEAFGFHLRDWLHSLPVYLWALLSIALLVAIAWYARKHFSKPWVPLCLKVGCALTVLAVLTVGTFYLGLTGAPEEEGTWQGEKIVMRKFTWMETSYSYYRYNGPFLLGEYLGWSEEPWSLER
ncbi:hypothetical protein ACTQ4E_02630 [Lawsonibacter sp. LCP25S3_G6]|uniref:hypothetical protein n=1 Tax=unclassified Lawsonibacter TaxID=2617946 RepID=UPI003F958AB3